MTNKYKLLLDAAKLMRSLADVVEAIAETYNDTVLTVDVAAEVIEAETPKQIEEKKEEKKKDETLALIYQDLEDRMKSVMGTKVSIHNKDKNKGRIEIEYYSEAELERIVEMIESIG